MSGGNNYKINKGFTLVEMIVTVAIFSIIVGTTTGIFVSAVRIQRYNLTTQELLNQTSYALEYMARFLRMARKDDIGGINCLVGDKTNYENPDEDETKIEFVNYKGPPKCQKFYLEGGRLKVDLDTDIMGDEFPLTSDKFDVTSLKFRITGAEQTDALQPRVTIFMVIEAISPSQPKPKLTIQTTISQRDLDLEE